ncbi:solute carrier family 2, facilitated glucose transporter member 1-like [Strongylocentrotus purpuratus]|uniref:Major facilitator superfamily (MFS) profile domain-containing protein n=1 Tax=Strongylocentrotus purpuratus TaxID=7668 RepID=A0A7M7NYQ4_STRPU|nr:solute carrier family 2, facilitated glucose transporter member 1-like [Strongylocentrotus purpuratus]
MPSGGYTFPSQGRPTLWLVISVIAVTFGSSAQYGYGIGVLTGPSLTMQDFYNQSNYDRRGEPLSDTGVLWLWSATISVWCIGGALGALVGGYLSDGLGRKGALLMINIFSLVAAVLFGFAELANSYEMVIIGRLIHGFYVGTAITIVPLYLAEISPINLRGAIGVIHQLMITIGILIGQALGLYAFTAEDSWPILLALIGVMSAFQLILLPFCPESPRWLLLNRNKVEKTRQALVRLRGSDDVEEEIQEIREEGTKDVEVEEKVGIVDVITLKDPSWKMPLLICMILQGGQQLSGINAVLFYATEIYRQTGMGAEEVAYATIGTGAINVVMTIISVYMVERAGRRILTVVPFGLMAICLALLTVSLNLQPTFDWMKWLSLIFIYAYIVSFAVGPGPVPFVIVPELWTQGPRPAAMSIAIQTNWWCNFLVGLTFPFIQATVGAYSFLVFMFFVILTTIFSYFYVPETKNRTFDDIMDGFRKGDKSGKKSKGGDYELQDNANKA